MQQVQPSPEVWLVRHGETEWSRINRHTGRTDIPLTPHGEDQARALGPHLAGRSFALVLVSPLVRARQTCDLAGFGERARVVPDLAEWNYGEYEGLTAVQVREKVPGWTVWTGERPGGETAEEVGARADRVIAEVEAAGGDVLIFAHGHLLRILTARWLGLAPRDGRLFLLDPACTSVLGWEPGSRTRVVRRWNFPPTD